jgi:hypothetical protein
MSPQPPRRHPPTPFLTAEGAARSPLHPAPRAHPCLRGFTSATGQGTTAPCHPSFAPNLAAATRASARPALSGTPPIAPRSTAVGPSTALLQHPPRTANSSRRHATPNCRDRVNKCQRHARTATPDSHPPSGRSHRLSTRRCRLASRRTASPELRSSTPRPSRRVLQASHLPFAESHRRFDPSRTGTHRDVRDTGRRHPATIRPCGAIHIFRRERIFFRFFSSGAFLLLTG